MVKSIKACYLCVYGILACMYMLIESGVGRIWVINVLFHLKYGFLLIDIIHVIFMQNWSA